MIDPDDNSDKLPIEKIGSRLRVRLPAEYTVSNHSKDTVVHTALGDEIKPGEERTFTLEDYKEQILDLMTAPLDVLYGSWPPWPKCPVPGCDNNTCLALDSPVCFVHTPGWAWWKRRRIGWRRFKMTLSDMPYRIRKAWRVLRDEDDDD